MLDRDGQPQIVDFGLATAIPRTGHLHGQVFRTHSASARDPLPLTNCGTVRDAALCGAGNMETSGVWKRSRCVEVVVASYGREG